MEQTAIDVIKQAIVTSKISKIIAQEALSVQFSDTASTASFDLGSRTLTLPYNINMSDEDIRTLFIFHEVSHALITPLQMVLDSNELKIKSEVNIVEDIRCEKYIKAKYPAIVKSFITGYKKLMDRGFFGKNISQMNFASRLNAYAKIGMSIASDVHFTNKEFDFYNRCYNAETPEEVLELAKELKELNKDSVTLNHSLEELLAEYNDTDIEGDDEFDNGEDEFTGGKSNSSVTFEEMLENRKKELQETDGYDEFYQKFEEGNIGNCKVETFVSSKITNFIPHKTIMANAEKSHRFSSFSSYEEKIREKRADYKRSVDYMARQFESKKAAYRHKNARISNTGVINTSRLFAYKVSDEIFKQSTTLADAKNHGFVILLDCSGSINNMWYDMVDQVIMLTEYFRMIKVPYKVYTFGHRVWSSTDEGKQFRFSATEEAGKSNFVNGSLQWENYPAEFLTSEQSNGTHNKMCAVLRHCLGFEFGGTPTMAALTTLEGTIVDFFNKRGIHKRKVLVITDGEPGDCGADYSYEDYRKSSVVCFDPMTKKSYQYPKIQSWRDSFRKVFLYGKIMKDRYDIDLIAMGITPSIKGFYHSFMQTSPSEADRKSFNQNFFVKKKDPYFGVDAIFIKPKNIEVDFDEMSISSEKSAKQNSRALMKTLKGLGKSRVLLNALNDMLAV